MSNPVVYFVGATEVTGQHPTNPREEVAIRKLELTFLSLLPSLSFLLPRLAAANPDKQIIEAARPINRHITLSLSLTPSHPLNDPFPRFRHRRRNSRTALVAVPSSPSTSADF